MTDQYILAIDQGARANMAREYILAIDQGV